MTETLPKTTPLGYARVSTYGQTLDAQLEQLRAAGCAKIYREKASGARADRRELQRLLKDLAAGDVVTVTRIDRLARSTFDLFAIVKRIVDAGGQFRSLAEPWADTGTSTGRLMIAVLGGLADVERDLIRTRTAEGRSRAKARGAHMGRPPSLTPQQQEEARQRRADGATVRELAASYNVGRSTISRLGERLAPLPTKPTLDADTARAARAFMKRLEGKYPTVEGLVYGSRARGSHRDDSDADIAVILKGERGDRSAAVIDMAGIAVDVLQETGILVQALPLWENEMNRPELFSNPALIENIKREGLRL
jgi:DNA invertase Pin-like site-specific DNA recombinase/predicted nucleotidyltransferase